MQEFQKISISEISKNDMLLILEALEFTGNKTDVNDFIQLKNAIVKDLSDLADASEEQFLKYLQD